MDYPDFETDILFLVKDSFPKAFVEKTLVEKLPDIQLSIEVEEITSEEGHYSGEWLSSHSVVNLFVGDGAIEQHWLKDTEDFEIFLEKFEEFLVPVVQVDQIMRGHREGSRPLASLSVFYQKKEDDLILRFLFDFEGNTTDYINALRAALALIHPYITKESSELQEALERTHIQRNRIVYLMYIRGEWVVQNPLKQVAEERNKKYREGKDSRIKKPLVLIHEDNYHRYYVFGDNWVLEADRLETFMVQPNDVSIYSSISNKNLQKAKRFYDNVIKPRHRYYHGMSPSLDQQKEYNNYFESIISAVIFAYTAVEAFVNICIPHNYEYMTEKTIYSKEAIERQFSLRDKLKLCLRETLETPNPATESWWSLFIDLEDIRNEIIHTKQLKSENRYSQFLTKRIFEIVDVHKTIIEYYGGFISKLGGSLLNEFPYNFGWDEVQPSLLEEEDYQRIHRDLYNPSYIGEEKGESSKEQIASLISNFKKATEEKLWQLLTLTRDILKRKT